MHDDPLLLLDECLGRLTLLRAELTAPRRVEPGERQAVAVRAILAARQFSRSATGTLADDAGASPGEG